MADRQIKVVILGDATSLQDAMGKADLSTSHFASSAHGATVAHGDFIKDVERGAASLEGLAQHVEYVAGGFQNLRGIMFGGALTFGFAEMIKGATDFDLQAEAMTRILNGNAEAGSAWAAIAQAIGIDAQSLATSFTHLSTMIETQRPILAQLGIATQDQDGKLLSLNQVIAESANWFHQHAGATNEAAVAQTLFGRNFQPLLPLLEQGSAGIATLTDEMKKMGYVVDSSTLQQQAAFAHSLDEARVAVQGIVDRLGNAFIPGLAALGQAIIGNEGIVNSWVAAINRAVSYVIGFVEGITGQTLKVGEAAQMLGNLTDQTAAYGTNADLAQRATRANTDAIDDQIAALQNQKTAMDDIIDDQIKQLQNEAQQAAFDDKIKAAKQKQAADEKRIADDKTKYQQDLLSGNLNNLQSILDDEQKAKEDEATQDQTIAKDTADFQRQQQIRSLQDQKAARDKDFQDQIKALQDLKSQMTKAGSEGAAGIADALGTLPDVATTTGNQIADNLKFAIDGQAESIGKGFGDTFETDLKTHNYLDAAKTVGKAIGDGIITGMSDDIEGWKNQHIGDPTQKFLIWLLGGQGSWAPSPDVTASGVANNPGGPFGPGAGTPAPVSQTSGGTSGGGPNQGIFRPASLPAAEIHNHFYVDGREVAVAIAGQDYGRSRGVR